ncbi:MAG: hypothetical protein JW770_02230 [Actinobacteria bacterium]|nr:hypothetical protein [Actinomycetota bacterium]
MPVQDIYLYISLFINAVLLGIIIYYGLKHGGINRGFKDTPDAHRGTLKMPVQPGNLEKPFIPLTSQNAERVSGIKGTGNQDEGEKLVKQVPAASLKASRDSLVLENLLDNIPPGVMVIDRDRRILKINEGLLNLFYIDRAETIGERTIFVFNNSRLEALISKAFSQPVPVRENVVFYREEDLYINVEVIPVSLKKISPGVTGPGFSSYGSLYGRDSEGGEEINLIILFNNITGEMEFSKLRSQFVANVSHEMRTPLTSIRGYLETLSATDITSDMVKTKSYLEKSLNEVEKLNFLIKDVLDLSRIEYRRNVLFKDKTELVEIINNCINFLDPLAKNNNNKIIFKHNQDHVYINADEELIQQMVRNLMENVIFHAGSDARLDISLRDEKDRVVIDFKDNGAGISEEDRPFIFQRFYRGKNTPFSKRTGSGLGLAIVKHTVELHKGKIKVDSSPGEGTHFHITFPKKS